MTLPGADTMKGGIMGDDCFLARTGAPFCLNVATAGMVGANCAAIESTGDASGEGVGKEDVEGEYRLAASGD